MQNICSEEGWYNLWAKFGLYLDKDAGSLRHYRILSHWIKNTTKQQTNIQIHFGCFMTVKKEVGNISMYCTVWNKIVKGLHVIFWNEKNGISDKSLWDPLGWKMAHSGRMHSICCIIIIFLIVQRNKMYFACHPVPQISIPS